MRSELAEYTLATVHPSSVLRQRTSEERASALDALIADLRVVAELVKTR